MLRIDIGEECTLVTEHSRGVASEWQVNSALRDIASLYSVHLLATALSANE